MVGVVYKGSMDFNYSVLGGGKGERERERGRGGGRGEV